MQLSPPEQYRKSTEKLALNVGLCLLAGGEDAQNRLIKAGLGKDSFLKRDSASHRLIWFVGLILDNELFRHSGSCALLIIVMANEKPLTDEYVAELLAKDAKESSIKYSALGLDGFATSK